MCGVCTDVQHIHTIPSTAPGDRLQRDLKVHPPPFLLPHFVCNFGRRGCVGGRGAGSAGRALGLRDGRASRGASAQACEGVGWARAQG